MPSNGSGPKLVSQIQEKFEIKILNFRVFAHGKKYHAVLVGPIITKLFFPSKTGLLRALFKFEAKKIVRPNLIPGSREKYDAKYFFLGSSSFGPQCFPPPAAFWSLKNIIFNVSDPT